MRVLAMTNLYPNPFQPHRAPFNRQQFRLLGARHPVQVIAPIAWTDELQARRGGATALPADRRVPRDGLTVDHPRYLFPPKLARGWYGHFYERSVRDTFRRAVAEFRPTVVLAPWAYPDGWAAVRLGHAAGLPVVVQVHGSDALLLDRYPARKRRTVEGLRAADGVVAVSADIARNLVKLGVPEGQVRVILDGVDPALFHPGPKADARRELGLPERTEPLALFVGNLLPVKAVDVLLRALAELRRGGFPVRLVVVGQGPLRATLEKLALTLGVGDAVTFTGPIAQERLPAWYRAADVFVLPSHSEGVPNVLLEASACGTPWVASRVGGVPEIAGRGVNLMVPPNSPTDLAGSIRAILSEPQPAPTGGTKLREAAVTELEAWLAEVAEKTAPGVRAS